LHVALFGLILTIIAAAAVLGVISS